MKINRLFFFGAAFLHLTPLPAQDSQNNSPSINFRFPQQKAQFIGSTAKYDQSGVFQSWRQLKAPDGVLAFRDDDLSGFYLIIYQLPPGESQPTLERAGFTNSDAQKQPPITSNNITFQQDVGTATLKKTGERVWVAAMTFSIDGTTKYYMVCYGDGATSDSGEQNCRYKTKEIIESIKPVESASEGTGADVIPDAITPQPVVASGPAKAKVIPVSNPANYPKGILIAGKPSLILSPYASKADPIDISGLSAGTAIQCPYTLKTFIIPDQSDASSGQ